MKLNINGTDHEFDVSPDTPLLWVIRDHAKLTGTKFGCGMAQCGACTVHLEGRAIRSCVSPVSMAEGKTITTIEGATESSEVAQALQTSWQYFNVPQCGYCQSGQIMSATQLLNQNKNPSDDDIDNAMNGNICRCATYQRIKAAIKHAAQSLA